MAAIKKTKKEKKRLLSAVIARYYKIFIIILLIFIISFSYYFILKPKYEQVGIGGKYNLETLKKELKKRQGYLKNLKELNGNYRKISKKEIDKLGKVLPKEKDIAGIFVQLEELTLKNDFLLTSININEIPSSIESNNDEALTINKLSITLNLVSTGSNSYNNLKLFLADLEDNLRLFDINAVYFSPGSTLYSVSLFTYYLE